VELDLTEMEIGVGGFDSYLHLESSGFEYIGYLMNVRQVIYQNSFNKCSKT
jgi:hypothetical protein